jgi:hypothetical protein
MSQLFGPIESIENNNWQEYKFASSRRFARSGLRYRFKEIKYNHEAALRRVHMGAFPELQKIIDSKRTEAIHNEFLRNTTDRLKSSSNHWK